MTDTTAPATRRRRLPMVAWIVISLVVGVGVGLALRQWAPPETVKGTGAFLKGLSGFVLSMLRLLATPLIFCAVILALVRAEISGRSGAKLLWLLATNTLMAIAIGLLVANVLRPGEGANLPAPTAAQHDEIASKPHFDPVNDFILKAIPKSFVDPFLHNDIVSLIVVALALGMALRTYRHRDGAAEQRVSVVMNGLEGVFDLVLIMLHWVFLLVPVAVFSVVVATISANGLQPLVSMGHFVVTVLVALGLQFAFYMARIRAGSWVRPGRFVKGASEALALAFSTASSTAALPVTYRCATEKIGARPSSASLGVMVGGSINNDGTALYEAMAALFISQALGQHLGLVEQAIVVLMAVVASVGAAGIPEAGLVTMIAVFAAVKLPPDYIPLLLPLDWFLDRCRTAINVSGDLTVTCLIDGRTPAEPSPAAS